MIEYGIYQPALHLEQVVELMKKVLWNGKSSEEMRDIFKWKYPENSNLVNGFVASDGNLVVGFRGFFIQNYIKDGHTFPVAVLGDAAVHPDYQRRGIFSSLTEQAIKYYNTTLMEYILALSSNSKSSPGYIKLGLTPFLPKEYKIGFSVSNMCCGFLKNKSKVNVSGFEIRIVDFVHIDTIAHELDIFCQSVDGKQGVSLRRDYHYWTWRFANPDWKAKFAVMYKNGEIHGVAAFLPGKRRGIKTITVLDVVVADMALFPTLYQGLKKMTDGWCYFILTTCGIPDKVLQHNFPLLRRSKTNTPADFYLIKFLDRCSDKELSNNRIVLNYSNID